MVLLTMYTLVWVLASTNLVLGAGPQGAMFGDITGEAFKHDVVDGYGDLGDSWYYSEPRRGEGEEYLQRRTNRGDFQAFSSSKTTSHDHEHKHTNEHEHEHKNTHKHIAE